MLVYRYHQIFQPFLVLLSVFSSVLCETSEYDESGLSLMAYEGESVILKCPLAKIEGDIYLWKRNNIIIKPSNRVYQNAGDLHIVSANRHQDAGSYMCYTRPHNDTSVHHPSLPISLEIIWLKSARIIYEATPSSSNPESVILKCQIEGSGQIELDWYKNNIMLKPSPHYQLDFNQLSISKPSSDDNGHYHCSAKNYRKTVHSEKLVISIDDIRENNGDSGLKCAQSRLNSISEKGGKRRNLRHAHEHKMELLLCRTKRNGNGRRDAVVVESGNQVVLNCNLKGVDRRSNLTANWTKDGKLFRQVQVSANGDEGMRDDSKSRISSSHTNGSLIIASTKLSDIGTYDCKIIDDTSTLSSRVTNLDITEVLKFVPTPTSKHIELGSTGKIHCKAQGTPTPSIHWIKEPSLELPETTDDINGTLYFKNVTFENSGNYTCIANNSQGVITATVVITTVIAPKFEVRPLGPINVNEMGTVMIHCLATGEPKPTIQWDKDLEYITGNNTDFSRTVIFENGTLQIRDVHVEDEGVYGCTIGNSAGLKREDARLIVKVSDEADPEEPEEEGFVINRAVYITLSVVLAYIILVFGLMIWCRVRRKARSARIQLIDKETNENNTGGNDHLNDEISPCLSPPKSKKALNGISKANGTNGKAHLDGAQKSDDTAASNHSKISKKSNFDQITMPRSVLFDIIQIGRGDFGDVFTAKVKASDLKHVNSLSVTVENETNKYRNSLNDIHEIRSDSEDMDGTKYALVKALNKVKDESICVEFRRQIDMFRAVPHPNVVHLFGLCRDKDPHYLVLEHTDLGDLKQFLLASTVESPQSPDEAGPKVLRKSTLKIEQLLSIAQQIARGMDAIYRARYIHKDIAARNCVISNNFVAKISYPALNKDKFSAEYYKHKNTVVPLRWMAPECLEIDDHTIKSDVYSFGVLVWEIFTSCQQIPEPDLSNEDFLGRLQSGKLTRSLPDGIPERLKASLISCWSGNQKERPSFSQIYSTISKSIESSSHK